MRRGACWPEIPVPLDFEHGEMIEILTYSQPGSREARSLQPERLSPADPGEAVQRGRRNLVEERRRRIEG